MQPNMMYDTMVKGQDHVFHRAADFTRDSEGGTNYHIEDKGGVTNFGISKRQYPDLDIEKLTESEAGNIYYKDYWLKTNCFMFQASLAIVLFDTAINCGQHSAAIWLQKSINLLKPVSDGPIKVDGIIGQRTLALAYKCDQPGLLLKLIAFRLRRYQKIIGRNKDQYKFVRGWVRRVSNLLLYI